MTPAQAEIAGQVLPSASPGEPAGGAISASSPEPGIDEINGEFPDAEAFISKGMFYARLTGIIIIAAAPTAGELREQLQDYFSRAATANAGSGGRRPGAGQRS